MMTSKTTQFVVQWKVIAESVRPRPPSPQIEDNQVPLESLSNSTQQGHAPSRVRQ